MSFSRLLYISQAKTLIAGDELQTLVATSSERNAHRGITGLLIASGKNFLQILEGEDLQVQSLYTRIENDPRHQDLQQLLFRPASSRMFPRWGMNIVVADQSATLDRARIDKTLLQLRLSKSDGQQDALTLLDEFRRQFESHPIAKSA